MQEGERGRCVGVGPKGLTVVGEGLVKDAVMQRGAIFLDGKEACRQRRSRGQWRTDESWGVPQESLDMEKDAAKARQDGVPAFCEGRLAGNAAKPQHHGRCCDGDKG